ncbi:nucleotidyltransferase domain-containing protein [Candidatus Poribacteria bacterium]|nr:nucleotidyltransferase domain-containing protein [Candidatus Poribacteria bacterium]
MPVRYLNSPIMKWPDAKMVDSAVRKWASAAANDRDDITQIGYFGSYARGDWGVGSDLDLIVILRNSQLPFEKRTLGWDTSEIPVPVDLMVYTEGELNKENSFIQTALNEAVWVYKCSEIEIKRHKACGNP